MKTSAFALIVLWSYLLIVSYLGLDSYSGAAMKNMGAWQLMLASAAIVPIVAMAVIFWENLQSDGNESVTEFVKWNKNQLKTYGVGVLLLIIIVGALVMAAAAICGVLVNSIFLTKAALKNRD